MILKFKCSDINSNIACKNTIKLEEATLYSFLVSKNLENESREIFSGEPFIDFVSLAFLSL